MAIVEEQFVSGGRDLGFASKPSLEGHHTAGALTFALRTEGFASDERKVVCVWAGWVHLHPLWRQGGRRTEKM